MVRRQATAGLVPPNVKRQKHDGEEREGVCE